MPNASLPRKPTTICSECGRINKNVLNNYGRAIVQHLAKRGEDVTTLALNIGTSEGAMHGFMHERKMSMLMLTRIATALEIPVSKLVADTEKAESASPDKKGGKNK